MLEEIDGDFYKNYFQVETAYGGRAFFFNILRDIVYMRFRDGNGSWIVLHHRRGQEGVHEARGYFNGKQALLLSKGLLDGQVDQVLNMARLIKRAYDRGR